METIDSNYEELRKFQKKLGYFRKKSETLSRIKLSFFEKMRDAEYQENIENAQQYYYYLQRATNLSYSIYHKMYQELSQFSLGSINEEFTYKDQLAIEEVSSSQVKQMYVSLYEAQKSYVEAINEFLRKVDERNLLPLIERGIQTEESMLQKLGTSYQSIFGELSIQKELHSYLNQEKQLSDSIISAIERLSKQTKTFAQKVKDTVNAFLNNIKSVSSSFKNKPLRFLMGPAEKAGITLEKHASLFAATIIGLSLVSKISKLLGYGSISTLAEEAILLLAEVGEGFQSIPFFKEFPTHIKQKFASFSQTLHIYSSKAVASINSLKATPI